MYSPEGQNKTIPLFLQEKQGELLFFNFIFSSSVLCQNQDFLYPSIHVRHGTCVLFVVSRYCKAYRKETGIRLCDIGKKRIVYLYAEMSPRNGAR